MIYRFLLDDDRAGHYQPRLGGAAYSSVLSAPDSELTQSGQKATAQRMLISESNLTNLSIDVIVY